MIPPIGSSVTLVQQMVEAAAAAYVHSTVSDPRTNAQANVTLDLAGNIVVAFKGSSAPADFLQDAKFGLSLDPAFKVLPCQSGIGPSCRKIILNKSSIDPGRAVKVHTGFLEDFFKVLPASCRKIILNKLNIDQSPAVKVHTGFLEDFNAIEDAVIAQVRQCARLATKSVSTRPASPGLFITGHSLGGALAVLCALECWRQALPVSAVYTFGQPRVGNAAFVALYDRTRVINGALLCDITFRVVNQNDIVPRTPGLLLGYRHGGTELFLPTDLDGGIGTGWQLNPGPWLRAWSDLLGLYGAWRHRRDVLVSEHFLSAYCRRIHALNQN